MLSVAFREDCIIICPCQITYNNIFNHRIMYTDIKHRDYRVKISYYSVLGHWKVLIIQNGVMARSDFLKLPLKKYLSSLINDAFQRMAEIE